MSSLPAPQPGIFIRKLPAILQASGTELDRFVDACEGLLLGNRDVEGDGLGLEQKIAAVSRCLDPIAAPSGFLPWIAGFLALDLPAEISEQTRRDLLALAVPLYRRRGTIQGMTEFLELLTGATVTITEPAAAALEVGRAIVGSTTLLGGERPHYFEISLRWPHTLTPEETARWKAHADAAIEFAKPAHTWYGLHISSVRSATSKEHH